MRNPMILSSEDEALLHEIMTDAASHKSSFECGMRMSQRISDDSRRVLLQEHADRLERRDKRIRALQSRVRAIQRFGIALTLVLAASWIVIAWLASVAWRRM